MYLATPLQLIFLPNVSGLIIESTSTSAMLFNLGSEFLNSKIITEFVSHLGQSIN
jgi:hypothetical protein